VIFFLLIGSGNGTSTAATVLFFGAALTDFIDGLLARGTGTVTELGRMLDPLADRIFISSTILALAITGLLPPVGVALVVARDIFMILGYKMLMTRGVKLRVSLLGKSYTALIMMAILLAMAGIKLGSVEIGWWLFWVGVAGSLLSGAFYLSKGLTLAGKSRITG
jgi:CDP-diacylglycerol--glycerol-3-phosphate 3-phosphatidyltransferase